MNFKLIMASKCKAHKVNSPLFVFMARQCIVLFMMLSTMRMINNLQWKDGNQAATPRPYVNLPSIDPVYRPTSVLMGSTWQTRRLGLQQIRPMFKGGKKTQSSSLQIYYWETVNETQTSAASLQQMSESCC